jgi:hypothetical protein
MEMEGARGAKSARLRQGFASKLPAATSNGSNVESKRRRGMLTLSTGPPHFLSITDPTDDTPVAEPERGDYIEKRFRVNGATGFRWFRGQLIRQTSRLFTSLWEVVEQNYAHAVRTCLSLSCLLYLTIYFKLLVRCDG